MPKMLPALPQAFGNLKDVFRSASDSLRGESNPLGFPKVKNSLVIMVDGLGWFNLNQHAGHIPFLKNFMNKSAKGYSGFPSTTAASLVSLATGVSPSEHGFIGYRIFNRGKNESVNLLTGLDANSVNTYLRANRVSDSDSDHEVVVVSRPEYLGSGFSLATFGDARFIGATEIENRFDRALDEINSGSGKLIYLYVPELDQAAHRFGVKSTKWLEYLELVDAQCRKLAGAVSPSRGIVLTADHGVVDVEQSNHVYLDEFAAMDALVDVGGDPRASFLYFNNSANIEVRQDRLNQWLSGRADAYTIQELIDAGLYSAALIDKADLLPDLVVLAAPGRACYHRSFSKPASLAMVGQHGGITDAEVMIPILRLGAYSSSLLVP